MKKLYILIVIVIVLVAVGFGSYLLVERNLSASNMEQDEVASTIQPVSSENKEDEVVLKVDNGEDVLSLFPFEMDEYAMQESIHFMSHGLVYAEQKWGKIELTEERIDHLLQVAKENENSYGEGSLYITILERWNDGDFSQAVEDHNAIWRLWGGTVGEATKLLTPAEIEQYNKKNFE
ncbi:DUF6241 domain-containing protein [Bacillus sp. JCM 19041]|uniref:DUF6241 domain-containing protein n=1 Tax=Bacillus sp. JCM 19041 TaxID=1460637 RepID=UPI0006D1E404